MADITVTGPDGSTFAFPEGTSGDEFLALSARIITSRLRRPSRLPTNTHKQPKPITLK